MKKISEHLGQIIVALAGVALLVAAVVVFKAPIGEFYHSMLDKETSITDTVLEGLDGIDLGDLSGGGNGGAINETDVVLTNLLTPEVQFSPRYATLSANDGAYTLTGDGTGTMPQMSVSTNAIFEPNHKYLVTCSLNGDFTNHDLASFNARLQVNNQDISRAPGWNFIFYMPEGPLALDCRDLYTIFETPDTTPPEWGYTFSFFGTFGSVEQANGAEFTISHINVIDVTDIDYTDYEALANAIYTQFGGKIEGTQTVSIKQGPYPLEEKEVLLLGDSIFGNSNVSGRLTYKSKATVYNCAIGGTTIANKTAFSLSNLSTAMLSGDYSAQEAGASSGSNEEKVLNRIKGLDVASLDYVVIEIGTNDWRRACAIGTNDSYDTSTLKGAYNTVIDNLLELNPDLNIIVLTPLFRTEFDANTAPNSSGVYLHEFVAAIEEIANKWGVPVYDMYNDAGVDATNSAYWLSDGTHPSKFMEDKIADIVYDMMLAIAA